MTDTTLNLVLSLDIQSQSYRPVAHNLSSQQAVEHVERLRADRITATLVAQQQSHRTVDVGRCQQCKKAAGQLADERNQAAAGQERQEQQPVPAGSDKGPEED